MAASFAVAVGDEAVAGGLVSIASSLGGKAGGRLFFCCAVGAASLASGGCPSAATAGTGSGGGAVALPELPSFAGAIALLLRPVSMSLASRLIIASILPGPTVAPPIDTASS